MRRLLAFAAVLAGLGLLGLSPAAAAPPVGVGLDRSEATTALGSTFVVRASVTNTDTERTDRYVAHLDVVSLSPDVYVDPEDWSGSRSVYVDPLGPGARTELEWEVHAVSAGTFDAYVVVLPNGPGTAGRGPLAISPPTHVRVTPRQTLSAGGSLPVAVIVPLSLGLAALTLRIRQRRSG